MDLEIVVTILLGLLAAGVPTVTFLAASKANRQQANAELVKAASDAKGVDALAYDRAAKIYEDMIGSLREQVDRLEARNLTLENDVASMRYQIAALQRDGTREGS